MYEYLRVGNIIQLQLGKWFEVDIGTKINFHGKKVLRITIRYKYKVWEHMRVINENFIARTNRNNS